MAARPDKTKPEGKDSSFPHDARTLKGRQVLRSMKRLLLQARIRMDDQLRPHGVTTAQMQVLFAVRTEPGSSGAQLARSCYITPQTTQALLKHLEERGLIVRGKDAVNDRIVTARITPEGERLARLIEKLSASLQDDLWQGVSDREIAQLEKIVALCLDNLGGATEEPETNCR